MKRNKEAGQALVLTAVALVMLMGFAGLAIDMGVLRHEKRLQQTAADAAALAGANNLTYGGVTAAGQAASAANGFSDTGTTCSTGCPNAGSVGFVTVTINNPPASGPHGCGPGGTCDANYVEALVTDVHPTYFMQVLGTSQQTVTARAVATNVAGSPIGGTGCVDTLGAPTKKLTGVSTSGSVTVNAPTCGINDNGNFVANGGANLNITAGSIGVSGTVTQNGTGTITPTPVPNVPAVGDPVQATPPCSGASCPASPSVKINNGGCVGGCPAGVTCSGGTCSMQPGDYSQICISGSTVNFAAGLYVLTGSSTCNGGTDFQVNGNSTVCNSTNADCSGMMGSATDGVTFYMTGGGSVNIDGTSTANFAAPTSGTYEGLLFYQDPSDTAAASLSGTNGTAFQGALYFPTAPLSFGGNNTTTGTFNGNAAFTLIIADYLTFSGNPTIELNSDLSGLSGNGGPLAGAITTARLVE